jgi:hypothetical protein
VTRGQNMPEANHYTGLERRHTPVELAAIERAVAEGIRQAVSDPALWEAAGRAMRQQAEQAAGGWLIGGARAVVQRIGWVLLIGWGVYSIGGWHALVALIKTQGAGGAP